MTKQSTDVVNTIVKVTKRNALCPSNFYCPLTMNVMDDPVIDTCGHTFERTAIVEWYRKNSYCPISRKPVHVVVNNLDDNTNDSIYEFDLTRNHVLAERIEKWKFHQCNGRYFCVQQKSNGKKVKLIVSEKDDDENRTESMSDDDDDDYDAMTKSCKGKMIHDKNNMTNNDDDDDIEFGNLQTIRQYTKRKKRIVSLWNRNNINNTNSNPSYSTVSSPPPDVVLYLPQERQLQQFVHRQELEQQQSHERKRLLRRINTILLITITVTVVGLIYRLSIADQ